MSLLVTGGAGFIGANFILEWLAQCDETIVNVDKLTYAGNLCSLQALTGDVRHIFVRAEIGDRAAMEALFVRYRPRAVLHFAAESHVDRSIHGPADFIATNVTGTFVLLEAACAYWQALPAPERAAFRFLHVSTDEVYGSLGPTDSAFTETTAYAPNSPYSASKAASDHLVRAYQHTYGLPTLTTHCSNNYGPLQFPEKLIPLLLNNALAGKHLPLYGDGMQIRDWLYVKDHCNAIRQVLAHGQPGGIWNIGGCNEHSNLDVAYALCDLLDALQPKVQGSYREQIAFVADRPGHDRRYAINADKIDRELGWRPQENFASGLRKTVEWYLSHAAWRAQIQTGSYRHVHALCKDECWVDDQGVAL